MFFLSVKSSREIRDRGSWIKNEIRHDVILSAAKDLLPPSSREVARLAATEGVIRTAEALFEE